MERYLIPTPVILSTARVVVVEVENTIPMSLGVGVCVCAHDPYPGTEREQAARPPCQARDRRGPAWPGVQALAPPVTAPSHVRLAVTFFYRRSSLTSPVL